MERQISVNNKISGYRMIRRREILFEWECLNHFEDFMFCVSRAWTVLIAIYLTTAVLFGLFAGALIYLRRKQRRLNDERAEQIYQEYCQNYH